MAKHMATTDHERNRLQADDEDRTVSTEPNHMTVIAIVFGVPAGCLWLTMFLGASVYAPATGVALGLVGSVCGAIGLIQTRKTGTEDLATAVIGFLCPVIGLVTSLVLTVTMVSAMRIMSETTEILNRATQELSSLSTPVVPSPGQTAPPADGLRREGNDLPSHSC